MCQLHVPGNCLHIMKPHLFVYLVLKSIFIVFYLQSFADKHCSGHLRCQFQVYSIVQNGIAPCPLELSSYLEASHICLPGTTICIELKITHVNLHSFADHQCSGTMSCEVVVFELIGLYHPCPRELSSYLEASYICLPGTLIPNENLNIVI